MLLLIVIGFLAQTARGCTGCVVHNSVSSTNSISLIGRAALGKVYDPLHSSVHTLNGNLCCTVVD